MQKMSFIIFICMAFFHVQGFCISSPPQIAITIDDHPLPNGPLFTASERTDRLLSACQEADCQAVFFCIGRNCKKNLSTLATIAQQDHFLANHSYSHPHLSALSVEDFEEEIIQTEAILSSYPTMRKWFRFPFLDYGNRPDLGGSQEKMTQALKILKKYCYTEGYVSINTFDWHLNARLQEALHNNQRVDYQALQRLYLDLIKEWCLHYVALYQKQLTQEITHTLLLHANDLNALYLKDILKLMNELGWTIVSPENAFNDVSWRACVFEKPGLVFEKPSTLDCGAIDRLLQKQHVFN